MSLFYGDGLNKLYINIGGLYYSFCMKVTGGGNDVVFIEIAISLLHSIWQYIRSIAVTPSIAHFSKWSWNTVPS